MIFQCELEFRLVVDPDRANDPAHRDPNPDPLVTQIEYRDLEGRWHVLPPGHPKHGPVKETLLFLRGTQMDEEWTQSLREEAAAEREYEPEIA